MSANAARGVLVALARADAGPTDADLLRRFAAARDEAAFTELVRRYGPLVLGVCRRVVTDGHLAEDAFQAVFVVLAKKANELDSPRPLGPWLYGVAHRVAVRARARIGRRRRWESLRATVPDTPTTAPVPDDSSGVLDEEIGKLSAAYREALVLCELGGLGRSEAARRLGIPEGTLSSRLAAARKILAARLGRRGVVASVTLGSAVAVPPALAGAAVRGASGSAPGVVLELAREALRAMRIANLKLVPAVVAVIAAVALPFAAKPRPTASAAPVPAAAPREGVIVVTRTLSKDRTAEVLDPAGTRVGQLNLGNVNNAWTPRLSPDGKRAAVLSYIPPEVGTATKWPSFALFVVDLDAKAAPDPDRVLATHVRCPSLAWSADGKTLYVSSIPKEKLRVADNVDQVVPVRTRVYDLAAGTDRATDIPEGHGVSDVARDGKSVLTTVQVKDPDAERLTNHIVPLDTLKPEQLGKEGLFEPRFSPDGKRVLGVRRAISLSVNQGLYVVDLAKKQETRVTLPKEFEGVSMERACWSADGKRVLFQWSEEVPGAPPPGAGAPGGAGGRRTAHRVSVAGIDGSNVKRIAAIDNGTWETITGIDWK
jgi:RNA polymerase sigma factor (sigma-70 family)